MHTRRRRVHRNNDEATGPVYNWSIKSETLRDDYSKDADEVIALSPCFLSMGQKWCMRVGQSAPEFLDQDRHLQVSLEVRDPPIRSDMHVLVQYTLCKRSPSASRRSPSPTSSSYSSSAVIARSPKMNLALCKGDHPNEYCASWPLDLSEQFDLICCFIETDTIVENVECTTAAPSADYDDEGISVSPIITCTSSKLSDQLETSPVTRREKKQVPPSCRRKKQSKEGTSLRRKRLRKTELGARLQSLPGVRLKVKDPEVALGKKIQLHSVTVETSSSTSSPTSLETNHYELIKDFAKLLNDNVHSDITFISPSKHKYLAHKSILLVRAPTMYRIFELCPKKEEVHFTGISDTVFGKLLEFIYTGSVLDSSDPTLELYFAAKKFALSGLAEKCLTTFGNNVQVENAADVLILARMNMMSNLEKEIVQFIKTHIKDFIKTAGFKRLYAHPDLLGQIICFFASDVDAADSINCQSKV